MGALYLGHCYATAADAASSALSNVAPVLQGDPPALIMPSWSGSGWTIARYEGVSLVSSSPVPVLDFAPCDPSQSAIDGLVLGGLVVAVWASAWAISVIRRAL